MQTEQKALLVLTIPDETHGLEELNFALSRGWRVVHATAMGGAGKKAQDGLPDLCFAALIIVERENGSAPAAAEERGQTAELMSEVVNDMAEGDGANVEVDDIEEPGSAQF